METYLGRTFTLSVEPGAGGTTFVGRFTLLDSMPLGDGAASIPPASGTRDTAHPSLDPSWASENEALSHARQAAHHAIETEVQGRPQGQGNHSVASDRRLAGE